MEDENAWCVGIEERGYDAEHQKIQRIFSQSTAGKISIFGGMLVLGFDILGMFFSRRN